ncbi:hypothetical protein BDN72DRAFT_903543 [Pluteus cervinus]|uniref:Uncharacterized protein n=1 Tax=Pluteus cervinus TaxID=181527 RepID=A0ACD3A958_9AGAR|nr:hypothetical protein BDN72DRAFT_903543 [Pluteus cervinus]
MFADKTSQIILNQALNRRIWINRLPVEMLGEIFLMVHRDAKLKGKAHQTLCITWVCNHWRVCATGYPALWTVITIPDMRCMNHFFTLSKKADLTIGMAGLCLLNDKVMAAIFNQTARTSHLHLHGSRRGRSLDLTSYIVSAASSAPNPALVSLCLRNINFAGLPFPFNPVTTLKLQYCSFLWNPSLVLSSKLINLQIDFPSIRISYMEILNQLHNTPTLQCLSLSHALDLPLDDRFLVEPISLPALECLDLKDSDAIGLTASTFCLLGLRTASMISVQLCTWSNDIEPIPSLLRAAHVACHSFPITCASILAQGDSWAHISLANEHILSTPRIDLRIEDEYAGDLADIILSSYPTEDIEYFRIGSCCTYLPAHNWIRIIGGHQCQLTTLILQDDSILEFQLSIDLARESFPRLATIIFALSSEGDGWTVALPEGLIMACLEGTSLTSLIFYGEEWDRSSKAVMFLESTGCSYQFRAHNSARVVV